MTLLEIVLRVMRSRTKLSLKNKMITKRGQISTEYLIVISFVVFLVLTTLGIAFFYSAEIRDAIKFNQIESFSQKIISLSESIYYSGEPSKTVATAYLPEGVNSIDISGKSITFTVSSSSGLNVLTFASNVELTGNISSSAGTKQIQIDAHPDYVSIQG